MATELEEFTARVAEVLSRFFRQNAAPAPDEARLAAFATRLWAVVTAHGLPRPLADDERGEPGGMTDEACAPLIACAVGDDRDPLLAEAARQLVKACVYPEFRTCRNSFREVAADGSCRRQELARVRRRVSGTHCVDCPHWVALTPAQHDAFLARQWRDGPEAFRAHREIFLPEDFRALRAWLHTASRRKGRG